MYPTMLRIILPVALLGHCNTAVAQQSAPSTGSYFRDLGSLIAEIRSVQWTVDICAESYPDTKTNNISAAEEWTAKNKSIIDEMKAKFDGLPAYWAGLDPQSAREAPALWAQVNEQIDSGRDHLKQEYLSQLGAEKMRSVCHNYRPVLQSERWNLQRYRANAIATIRTGPKDDE